MLKFLRKNRTTQEVENDSIGIDITIDALDGLLDAQILVTEVMDDGKVTKFEGLQLIWNVGKLAMALSKWKEIKEEIKLATDEEIQDLVDHFADRFDINNDQAEQIIENAIAAIVSFLNITSTVEPTN